MRENLCFPSSLFLFSLFPVHRPRFLPTSFVFSFPIKWVILSHNEYISTRFFHFPPEATRRRKHQQRNGKDAESTARERGCCTRWKSSLDSFFLLVIAALALRLMWQLSRDERDVSQFASERFDLNFIRERDRNRKRVGTRNIVFSDLPPTRKHLSALRMLFARALK